MVVIFFPATADTWIWQDLTAAPSRCTVHAPHWAAPHPNLVPVSWRCSRITHRSGVSGSTSTVWGFPLISSFTTICPPCRQRVAGADCGWGTRTQPGAPDREVERGD